jgi:hypothetical protein
MIIINDVLWELSAAGQHAVYAAARPHSYRLHTNTYLSLTNYCQSKLYNCIIIILISKLQLQIWLAIQHRVVRCLAPACWLHDAGGNAAPLENKHYLCKVAGTDLPIVLDVKYGSAVWKV